MELENEKKTNQTSGTDVEKQKEYDPWALPELENEGKKWSELTPVGKVKRTATVSAKVVLLFGLLYLFICSLSFLSSAFRLLGGKAAGRAFSENKILSNPIAGLMIGVLVTVLVQSSSTSTSIIVAMVASGVLSVNNAIPIIMGANIGTTVTNTIVSMGQSIDRDQFRRAFAAATVHDMFNVLSVVIFLPLEVITGYLFYLTEAIVDSGLNLNTNKNLKQDYLKKITKPFESRVIQIDKKVIEKIARATTDAERLKYEQTSLLKNICKKVEQNVTLTTTNSTTNSTWEMQTISTPCSYLFHGTTLSDSEVGIILLVVSLVMLCICLICIVKLLHSMLKGRLAVVVRKVVNTDFPEPFGFLTGYLAIIVGAIMTFLVQSSSIFTSAVTPLVGIGVVGINRMYPLTLGSNIGTTTTALLAAFAAGSDKIRFTLQIALCHLFFNISGILVWYPVPLMREVPINLAKGLGNITAKYRWFALAYIFFMFFVLPGIIFALSIAGWEVLTGVGIPIVLFFIVISIINLLQNKRRTVLPKILQSWDWAPIWTKSLDPYDRVFRKTKEMLSRKSKRPEAQHEPRNDIQTFGNAGYIPDDIPDSVVVE